ncbi:MAG: AbrB/MazE/SpoVT family DNA-binding domain-containing protein [Limnochordia bacterium]|jgi:antitoxin MazE|nr:AbrB/MazE/SpoVT family DNA-binding domain-containing protein [Limnochordia bacterium]MDD2629874.1 AbrB/MazE/SpoVT family DNA-binding domain-containing protein [Limnochordia bacterium]MDD4517713.1 AbrB/MazE/SpoVT family DNA-binding domain-containing protein [Limnochordia bacterium]
MLVELRSRSQITIPAEVVRKLGAVEGDKLEVVEKDGGIFLCPVVVCPKAKMEQIAKLVRKADTETHKLKAYDDVDQMFMDMGNNPDEL